MIPPPSGTRGARPGYGPPEQYGQARTDARYHVSRDYLLDESHYYSHEFNLYVNEFARQLCGDPNFHFHRGLKSIPAGALALARPLSLRQLYTLVPRFTARVTEADFQVVSTTLNSAVLRWLPARQLAQPAVQPSPALCSHGLPGLPGCLLPHPAGA